MRAGGSGRRSDTADASGNLLGQVLYYPFGDTRVVNGSTATTFRYTGQRQQTEIGLYYYGARWYDSVIGRFAAPDTIVPNSGSAQSLNRYSYTRNNPLRYVDPTGHIEGDGQCGGATPGQDCSRFNVGSQGGSQGAGGDDYEAQAELAAMA